MKKKTILISLISIIIIFFILLITIRPKNTNIKKNKEIINTNLTYEELLKRSPSEILIYCARNKKVENVEALLKYLIEKHSSELCGFEWDEIDEYSVGAVASYLLAEEYVKNNKFNEALIICNEMLVKYENSLATNMVYGTHVFCGNSKAAALSKMAEIYKENIHDYVKAIQIEHKIILKFPGEIIRVWEGQQYFDKNALEYIIDICKSQKYDSKNILKQYYIVVNESKSDICKAEAYLGIVNEYINTSKNEDAIKTLNIIKEKFKDLVDYSYMNYDKAYYLIACLKEAEIYSGHLNNKKKKYEIYTLLTDKYKNELKKYLEPEEYHNFQEFIKEYQVEK